MRFALAALIISLSPVTADAFFLSCQEWENNDWNETVAEQSLEIRHNDSRDFLVHYYWKSPQSASPVKELWVRPEERSLTCFASSAFEIDCSDLQPSYPTYVRTNLLASGKLRLEMQTIYGSTVFEFDRNACVYDAE